MDELHTYGFCSDCNEIHSLPQRKAFRHAVELMKALDTHNRIDFTVPESEANPALSTDYLWGSARGQMFGVMVAQNEQGEEVVVRAFSGQYNGIWDVEGWAPPLVDAQKQEEISHKVEARIKELTRQIEMLPEGFGSRVALQHERRELSQGLMKKIHTLYYVTNFSGETRSLRRAFGSCALPTGTGECCAPKLLNYAVKNNLKPVGLAEFFYGRENRSGKRQHGEFYPACKEKCQPILGFMLCGLEDS